MKNVLLQAAIKLNNAYRNSLWRRWLVRMLAMVVVFCTTYLLILPALTMQSEADCGLQEHIHTDSCYSLQAEQTAETQVLICTLEEHIHADACYPLIQEEAPGFTCGLGEHTHMEGCFGADGVSICTIPEHSHEAACMVAGLDLTADTESPQQWEASLQGVKPTGNWAQDLLAVAQSQLGYGESRINVVLEGDALQGYTRYGAWYGQPYGVWDCMFAAFCLHYAEITQDHIPYSADAADWAAALQEKGFYKEAGSHHPAAGDLVFWDTDGDGGADRVAIVTGAAGDSLSVIAGDPDAGKVLHKTLSGGILGYAVVPENPLSPEQWIVSEDLKHRLSGLPAAEDVQQSLQALNQQGDKAGYEALRQEVLSRVNDILTRYETLDPLQKDRTGDPELARQLQNVCSGGWSDFPALTDDSAVVTGLRAPDPYENPKITNGDRIEYTFTVDTASYYTDVQYGQARIRLELVLPAEQYEAKFDTASLDWLENRKEWVEYRNINGADTRCQVITGYGRLRADGQTGIVVPGSFTQTVGVLVENMTHGSQVAVIVSAAMEHGTWEGLCQTHQIPEKLTVVTQTLTVDAPLPADQQQKIFENHLQQLENPDASAALEQLQQKIDSDYATGALSEEHYSVLHQKVLELTGVDLDTIAEPSNGNGWAWMDFDPVQLELNEVPLTAQVQTEEVPVRAAMPQRIYKHLGLDSNSQIPENGWGGENSADDVIWVSKTIEGTGQENIFEITLQVITKEKVNEVYKEPDMAVVIVMDISNTMTSVFSGEKTVTRYDAAMTSAQQFLESFAEKTDGISRVGYVAFNTHAHEVFSMQPCGTAAQAKSLANTMRTKTASIMKNAANATSNGSYASSHDRFTNIQAGLKMARDMLNDATNQHKYVIFLSDGFPTTYVKSGYKGYDPYTDTGSNGTNGVFYDNVMGVHCDYGTSYSDTAAIKARQMAVSMKKTGINIFSIGVDVAGQTIKQYHDDSINRLKTSSTVERRESVSYYKNTGYEIGTLHSEITRANPTAAQVAAMAQDFKDWLKGTASAGIGSGYYYDSTDLSGLEKAYSSIFAKILEMNAASAHLDWVATDPMPDMGVHELETVEFIGFWDADNVLQQVLEGKSQDNALYLNSATFDTAESTIHWDLKNSGYQSVSLGNGKNYMCALKYRVRLRNENGGFVEKQIYDTNDTTFLNYRVIEVVNNVTAVSDRKYIEFPIPKVFGYLSELTFQKIDSAGTPLSGAGFALTHDEKNCGSCRGDGVGTVKLPVYEAVSGADGMVKFQNIPSGHHYILTETKTPVGYETTENTYLVEISYDAQTVTVLDADGNPLEWTSTIVNHTYYVLPETGGTGKLPFVLLGGLLIFTAAMMYMTIFGRKRQEGGKYIKPEKPNP